MRRKTALVVALASSLLFPAGPALGSSKPTPPTVSVTKGTYFSKSYKANIRAPKDGWITKSVLIAGKGIRKKFAGISGKLLLPPGRYRLTRVYYVLKRPGSVISLKSLPEGAKVIHEGSVVVAATTRNDVWKWDPLLDQNKGLAYLWDYQDPLFYARDTGGSYLGRLACLNESLGQLYYNNGDDYFNDQVSVADDDPRIYEPAEESPYLVYSSSLAPETPGQRHWFDGHLGVSPCPSRRAFRLGQEPSDFSYTAHWNHWRHVVQLPDGNWYQTTEQSPSSYRWRGTATVTLPSGVTYKGAAMGPKVTTESKAASSRRSGTLDLQPMPGLTRTKRIVKTVNVRGVNAGWASNAEVRAIKMGMSKSEVFRIIGSAGSLEVRASGLEVRQWYGRWGDLMVTVGFSGGRVASIVY